MKKDLRLRSCLQRSGKEATSECRTEPQDRPTDVRSFQPGVFYGKSGVQQFFSNFGQISFERFEVTDIIAVDDSVVDLVDCRSTVKATGKSFEGTLVHVMTLRDDKIKSWDEYEDASNNPWI